MADLSETIAAELAQRRHDLGLTLEEVGNRAGLHRTAVSLVERRKRTLTLESAQRLCVALDLKLSDLVRRAEQMGGE